MIDSGANITLGETVFDDDHGRKTRGSLRQICSKFLVSFCANFLSFCQKCLNNFGKLLCCFQKLEPNNLSGWRFVQLNKVWLTFSKNMDNKISTGICVLLSLSGHLLRREISKLFTYDQKFGSFNKKVTKLSFCYNKSSHFTKLHWKLLNFLNVFKVQTLNWSVLWKTTVQKTY